MNMSGKVFDFSSKKQEVVEEKKRAFERVVFDNFIGCYTVIDEKDAIHPIRLVDISLEGCQIEAQYSKNLVDKFTEDDEICLRMYFTKKSFIPILANVKHINECIAEGQKYLRFGCQFDKSVSSYGALSHFVKFISSYSEHSTIEQSNNKIFFV
jgi:hypothetical protein